MTGNQVTALAVRDSVAETMLYFNRTINEVFDQLVCLLKEGNCYHSSRREGKELKTMYSL